MKPFADRYQAARTGLVRDEFSHFRACHEEHESALVCRLRLQKALHEAGSSASIGLQNAFLEARAAETEAFDRVYREARRLHDVARSIDGGAA